MGFHRGDPGGAEVLAMFVLARPMTVLVVLGLAMLLGLGILLWRRAAAGAATRGLCRRCAHRNSSGARFCSLCGAALNADGGEISS
jgi:hypothetical protein